MAVSLSPEAEAATAFFVPAGDVISMEHRMCAVQVRRPKVPSAVSAGAPRDGPTQWVQSEHGVAGAQAKHEPPPPAKATCSYRAGHPPRSDEPRNAPGKLEVKSRAEGGTCVDLGTAR